jgi:hypothetical protein
MITDTIFCIIPRIHEDNAATHETNSKTPTLLGEFEQVIRRNKSHLRDFQVNFCCQ